MNEQTELDRAHAGMMLDEDNTTARLRFYERLADTEFFLLLENEPDKNIVKPQVFSVENDEFVLIFDLEERLAEFSGGIVPYIAISGRAVAKMLAGKNIGLGVNLGVAPSSILIPSDAVDWLLDKTSAKSDVDHDRPTEVSAPVGLPDILLGSLATKLAVAADMAKFAFLVRANYSSGRCSHLLGFVDANEVSEPALYQAVSEALVFSGGEAGSLDVAFFKSHDEICASLARVGLRIDIPQSTSAPQIPSAPGMNPEKPPRLR
jgi:hypothetical protein